MSPETPAAPIPTGRLALQFLLFLIGGMVLLIALYWVLETFAGYDGSSGNVMGIVLPPLVAMSMSSWWYQKEKARPASGRLWKLSLICGLVAVGINAALVALLYQAGLLQDLLGGLPPDMRAMRFFAGIFAGYGVVQILLIRAGFWFGFRSAEKQAQRLAATKPAGK
jgi:hypothetical protein